MIMNLKKLIEEAERKEGKAKLNYDLAKAELELLKVTLAIEIAKLQEETE